MDTLLFNWVAFFAAFPATYSDINKLQGSSKYQNCDARYTLMSPKNVSDPDEVVYFPIQPNQKPSCDELRRIYEYL